MYSTSYTGKNQKLVEACEQIFKPHDDLSKLLISGEIVVYSVKEVISYVSQDENSRGATGTLICTNFRLIFLSHTTSYCNLLAIKHKLLEPQDITLSNIETIYITKANGKKKRLYPSSSVKDGLKNMELHCKDFRILSYSFKLSVLGEGKKVVQSILHHSYPSDTSLSFALNFVSKQPMPSFSKVPLYRSKEDWENLIIKHKLEGQWYVCTANRAFSMSSSMSQYFLIPSSLKESQLSEVTHQFTNNRLPVWCYTHLNGCSLVKMTRFRAESVRVDIERQVEDAIGRSDQHARPFKTFDLNKLLASDLQLRNSFNKLKSSCMPDSEDEYLDSDSRWFSLLQSTKWLQHISNCLQVAQEAANYIESGVGGVRLIESSGVDMTPCITCLIQLILDDNCRTVFGLMSLIQREWIIGSHPFTDRLGILHQPKKSKFKDSSTEAETLQAPFFLLFLDCVFQLIHQHPSHFQFTSFFLLCLADGTRLPCFDTFIFNNERLRSRILIQAKKEAVVMAETLPIWDWSYQFDEKEQKLFYNPLYSVNHLTVMSSSVNNRITRCYSDDSLLTDTSSSWQPQVHRRAASSTLMPYKLPGKGRSTFFVSGDDTEATTRPDDLEHIVTMSLADQIKAIDDVIGDGLCRSKALEVATSVSSMKFWEQAYLRWVTYSQLIGGGTSCENMQIRRITDQLIDLDEKIKNLRAQLNDDVIKMKSVSTDDVITENDVTQISSYFPFLSLSIEQKNRTTLGKIYNFSRRHDNKSSPSLRQSQASVDHISLQVASTTVRHNRGNNDASRAIITSQTLPSRNKKALYNPLPNH